MAKDGVIEVEAVVKAALPNAMFRLEIEMGETKHEILGHISGKMRRHYIRITPGDHVRKWQTGHHALVSTPVVHAGRAYVIFRKLQCVDMAGGKLLWRGGDFGHGSCLVTGDGKLIVFGNGKLVLIDPAAGKYSQLSRVSGIVDGTCYPQVALSDGVIACKDRAGTLVCLSVRARGRGK
ncbi:hypothetical protein LCGC14_0450170 [marine sediment metagenome]|uniref:S1-like domain-containing protein n=1 Tax=marine sediment metagenome TaxID=412755 RepID=A0A0F9V4X2_9ZZZZ